jgi:zinc protease
VKTALSSGDDPPSFTPAGTAPDEVVLRKEFMMRSRGSWLLATLAVLALMIMSASVDARVPDKDLPDGVSFYASVEGIDEYRLENGLRVILFPDPSKQTATVNITYLVGSLHEGYGETGMAHLLEHLVFKGTPKHPDIPQELTAHGCRPNGSTWYDRTNYFETFSATDENLEWALDLEADRMVNSFISAEDLESEMTVVRNEFEIGENNPQAILEERIYSTAFLWHNYGNTTIGARSDIESVPIENLQAFYRRWYRPENAVLVVAGKIDEKKTIDLVKEKYGPIQNPEEPLPQVYTSEPSQDGPRTVTLRRVGDMQAVGLGYHIPAGSHPDYPALQVMAFLLDDAPSGRLHKKLIETKKATAVSAWANRFRDPGLMYIDAELRVDGNLEEVRDIMIEEVEGFVKSPPATEDVERAKTNLHRNWELTMRDSPRAAIRLSEWAAMGDWRMMFLHRDWLEQVTAANVVRVAETYFKASNRTTGVYIPTEAADRVEIPEAPEMEEMLEGYTGREAMAQGEGFDVSPESIEKSLQRTVLDNGMKFIVLPKENRGETVSLVMSLHFGSEETLKNQATVGELSASMLMRGTKNRTRQEIEDEIARLQIRMNVWGWAGGASGRIEATRETLPDAVRLLADVLMNPTFPENEFDQIVERELQSNEEAKSEPRSQSFIAMRRHMSPWPKDDVRYVSTSDEAIADLKACKLDQLKTFHDNFYGCSSAELAIVGDFDAPALQDLVVELFADWNCKTTYERLTSPYMERPAIMESIQIPDKESAVFTSSIRINMSDSHPDYPALVIGNFMTGGGFLNSRLATRIRRTDGLSYGVGSRFWANVVDENAWFGGFAIYAPQNDEKLVSAFREELVKIRDKGFTDDELAEAKSGWLQSRDVSRSNDRELVQRLASHAHNDRTMEWDAELEKKIAEITGEEILTAFRKHIDPDKMSVVRAGDFEKVEKKESGEKDSAEKQ